MLPFRTNSSWWHSLACSCLDWTWQAANLSARMGPILYWPSYSKSMISDWEARVKNIKNAFASSQQAPVPSQNPSYLRFQLFITSYQFFGLKPSTHQNSLYILILPSIFLLALSLLVCGSLFMLSTKGTKLTSNPPHGPDELHASKRMGFCGKDCQFRNSGNTIRTSNI